MSQIVYLDENNNGICLKSIQTFWMYQEPVVWLEELGKQSKGTILH